MARAREEHSWTHTSEIIAALYNTVRDPKKRHRPYTGREFNPYVSSRQKPTQTITVEQWRDMVKGSKQVRRPNKV